MKCYLEKQKWIDSRNPSGNCLKKSLTWTTDFKSNLRQSVRPKDFFITVLFQEDISPFVVNVLLTMFHIKTCRYPHWPNQKSEKRVYFNITNLRLNKCPKMFFGQLIGFGLVDVSFTSDHFFRIYNDEILSSSWRGV